MTSSIYKPRPARPAAYRAGCALFRFIHFQCIRSVVLHPERVQRPGGLLLACTHISHLEPVLVSMHLRRQIRWMAREEFYRRRWGATLLHLSGAFPVDRFGFNLPSVRRAIDLVRTGELVGIFPEAGVATGARSLLRGGPMKAGVCTIALRTNTPIVPVVVLGTEGLNRVGAWVPPRRGRVYVALGREVAPGDRWRCPPGAGANRAARAEVASRLRAEFVRTYEELLAHAGLTDADGP